MKSDITFRVPEAVLSDIHTWLAQDLRSMDKGAIFRLHCLASEGTESFLSGPWGPSLAALLPEAHFGESELLWLQSLNNQFRIKSHNTQRQESHVYVP